MKRLALGLTLVASLLVSSCGGGGGGSGILPLSLVTAALQDATVNVVYQQALQASGGVPPYSWTLTSGALPLGLNLQTNGIIAGIPTAGGAYNITVRVTDSALPQAQASKALTLTVQLGNTAEVLGTLFIERGPRPAGLQEDQVCNSVSGEVLVLFPGGMTEAEKSKVFADVEVSTGLTLTKELHTPLNYYRVESSEKTAETTRTLLRAFRALGKGIFVESNCLAQATAIPNDTYYHYQWHYPLMNLPAAWDLTTGDPNIVVSVIDTGYIPHPDLLGNIIPGYDFISSPSMSLDGDGRDDIAEDPGDERGYGKSSWHGTHVAGTIGALTNNNSGVAGVMGSVKIQPVRALGKGGGSTADIIDSIYWAAGYQIPGVPNNPTPAWVINMSLGGVGCDPMERAAVQAANAVGTVVVVAAGNETDNAINHTPACVPEAITVGAINMLGDRADYSNFGSIVDVTAPGGDVTADVNGDGYQDGVLSTLYDESSQSYSYKFYQGTSMSAPHVAGVVGLMLSVNPTLTPAEVENILKSTANSAYQCPEGCGAGLVDAYAAVLAAQSAPPPIPNPTLSVFPPSFDLGAYEDSGFLLISNSGNQPLNYNVGKSGAVAGNVTLQPTSGTLDPGESTGVAVSVSRAGLASGDYTVNLGVSSNGGNATVPLTFSVTSATFDVGTVYILLVDANTGNTVFQGQTTAASAYSYRLTAVPPGVYLLAAGTDQDNDNFIDDDGEFFGLFPLTIDPLLVPLTAGTIFNNANFFLSLQQPSPASAHTGPTKYNWRFKRNPPR